jgi:hypothetical protein
MNWDKTLNTIQSTWWIYISRKQTYNCYSYLPGAIVNDTDSVKNKMLLQYYITKQCEGIHK